MEPEDEIAFDPEDVILDPDEIDPGDDTVADLCLTPLLNCS